ncbi:unnamed protein product [Sphagnum balticum]
MGCILGCSYCWALLLLLFLLFLTSTFPLLASAGRRDPRGATMHSGHDEFISALAPVLHHDDHEADILNARTGAAAAEHVEEIDNNLSYSQQHSLQQNEIRAGPITFSSWVQVWKDYNNKSNQQKKQLAAAAAAGNSDHHGSAEGSWTDDQLLVHNSRLLIGSSPPTCRGSCGVCYPCNPVHVIIGIPRVAITEQEYYPEVWRCQCGNMLFMP